MQYDNNKCGLVYRTNNVSEIKNVVEDCMNHTPSIEKNIIHL